jgi:hypothetical protein
MENNMQVCKANSAPTIKPCEQLLAYVIDKLPQIMQNTTLDKYQAEELAVHSFVMESNNAL